MLKEDFWQRRFSVGLTLDTTYDEFRSFIEQYAGYIDNFYLSLPLGDRHHCRDRVAQLYGEKEKQDLFWQLVDCIRMNGVKIDLLFNNHTLTDADVVEGRELLDRHEITADKVTVLDGYYDVVRENFPNSKIVYSVNNLLFTFETASEIKKQYDEIVVGRQEIRNARLFHYIKNERGANVILLMNNGCSHTCGGCRTFDYCKSVYERDSKKYSTEYVYALQSIFPFEIHEGLIDTNDVSLFKISNRNANVKYTRQCIDSYIHNQCEELVSESRNNYMLWSRLAWNMEHFDSFDLERIIGMKRDICKAPVSN